MVFEYISWKCSHAQVNVDFGKFHTICRTGYLEDTLFPAMHHIVYASSILYYTYKYIRTYHANLQFVFQYIWCVYKNAPIQNPLIASSVIECERFNYSFWKCAKLYRTSLHVLAFSKMILIHYIPWRDWERLLANPGFKLNSVATTYRGYHHRMKRKVVWTGIELSISRTRGAHSTHCTTVSLSSVSITIF